MRMYLAARNHRRPLHHLMITDRENEDAKQSSLVWSTSVPAETLLTIRIAHRFLHLHSMLG